MPQLIGTAPNQVPLNQFLGDMAFQDSAGVNVTGGILADVALTAYAETVVALGTVTSTATLAITTGTIITATLTSATACTFAMPTATAGKRFTLLLKQPATGTATTATFTPVKWPTAGAPTITATLGRLDILTFISDGVNWYGTVAQGFTY
jgi:molybdopterin-binding protein